MSDSLTFLRAALENIGTPSKGHHWADLMVAMANVASEPYSPEAERLFRDILEREGKLHLDLAAEDMLKDFAAQALTFGSKCKLTLASKG